MAELVGQHPGRFAGFAAALPLSDPEAATDEAIRAVRELGALGVQLDEDANNLPLHEERYDPLFAAMEQLDGRCGCTRSATHARQEFRQSPFRSCSTRHSPGFSTPRLPCPD